MVVAVVVVVVAAVVVVVVVVPTTSSISTWGPYHWGGPLARSTGTYMLVGMTLREEGGNHLPPSSMLFWLAFRFKAVESLPHSSASYRSSRQFTGELWSQMASAGKQRGGCILLSSRFRTLIASILHTSGICDHMCYAVHMCFVYPYNYIYMCVCVYIYVKSCWVYSESVQLMQLSPRFVLQASAQATQISCTHFRRNDEAESLWSMAIRKFSWYKMIQRVRAA